MGSGESVLRGPPAVACPSPLASLAPLERENGSVCRVRRETVKKEKNGSERWDTKEEARTQRARTRTFAPVFSWALRTVVGPRTPLLPPAPHTRCFSPPSPPPSIPLRCVQHDRHCWQRTENGQFTRAPILHRPPPAQSRVASGSLAPPASAGDARAVPYTDGPFNRIPRTRVASQSKPPLPPSPDATPRCLPLTPRTSSSFLPLPPPLLSACGPCRRRP